MYSNKTIFASYCLIVAGIIMFVIWLFLLFPGGENFYRIQILRIVLPFIGSLCIFTGWLVLHTVREAFEEVSLVRVELRELSARLDRVENRK